MIFFAEAIEEAQRFLDYVVVQFVALNGRNGKHVRRMIATSLGLF